jgi:hypothetical protein
MTVGVGLLALPARTSMRSRSFLIGFLASIVTVLCTRLFLLTLLTGIEPGVMTSEWAMLWEPAARYATMLGWALYGFVLDTEVRSFRSRPKLWRYSHYLAAGLVMCTPGIVLCPVLIALAMMSVRLLKSRLRAIDVLVATATTVAVAGLAVVVRFIDLQPFGGLVRWSGQLAQVLGSPWFSCGVALLGIGCAWGIGNMKSPWRRDCLRYAYVTLAVTGTFLLLGSVLDPFIY